MRQVATHLVQTVVRDEDGEIQVKNQYCNSSVEAEIAFGKACAKVKAHPDGLGAQMSEVIKEYRVFSDEILKPGDVNEL